MVLDGGLCVIGLPAVLSVQVCTQISLHESASQKVDGAAPVMRQVSSQALRQSEAAFLQPVEDNTLSHSSAGHQEIQTHF